MRLTTKWIATVAMAAVLGAGAATASAQDGVGKGDGSGHRERGQRVGGRFARGGRGMKQRWMKVRHARGRHARQAVAEALALTPDQQRLVLEKARAAQPIVAESRKEVAKLLAQAPTGTTTDTKGAARGAERAAKRAAMKDLRTRTAEKLAPLAKDLVAALTPEQKAKLQGMAAARGRTFDEAKFVRAVSHWIARPMTADLMEAKLGTR